MIFQHHLINDQLLRVQTISAQSAKSDWDGLLYMYTSSIVCSFSDAGSEVKNFYTLTAIRYFLMAYRCPTNHIGSSEQLTFEDHCVGFRSTIKSDFSRFNQSAFSSLKLKTTWAYAWVPPATSISSYVYLKHLEWVLFCCCILHGWNKKFKKSVNFTKKKQNTSLSFTHINSTAINSVSRRSMVCWVFSFLLSAL